MSPTGPMVSEIKLTCRRCSAIVPAKQMTYLPFRGYLCGPCVASSESDENDTDPFKPAAA